AGCIVLHGGLVAIQVPDSIAGLYFVYRASSVLEQAIRFRLDAIKVLCGIAESIVIDLDFEARNHRLPCRVAWIECGFMACAPIQLRRREIERGAREAQEHTAVVLCGVEHPELEP